MDLPVSIYLVTCDVRRKERMLERFGRHQVVPKMLDPILPGSEELTSVHERFRKQGSTVFGDKYTSGTLNHLRALADFLSCSDQAFCVVSEDDVHLSKTFIEDLLRSLRDFSVLNLDVLLLGYLMSLPLSQQSPNLSYELLRSGPPAYYSFPDDLWGAQMYMVSRAHAAYLVDKYLTSETFVPSNEVPFAADWILTKEGRRALVYPMLAVEEGQIADQSHQGQVDFHRDCFLAQFDADRYDA